MTATILQFPTQARETAPAAESAKLLKQALRAAFPAARFSVRLSRGTGYGNCYVNWIDGPSVAQVSRVTDRFEGAGFDGMTDSSYHKDAILADGRDSGLRLILEERRISVAFARRLAEQVATFYGVAVPAITEESPGYWWIEDDSRFVADTREYWSTLIHRAAHDRTRYQVGK